MTYTKAQLGDIRSAVYLAAKGYCKDYCNEITDDTMNLLVYGTANPAQLSFEGGSAVDD